MPDSRHPHPHGHAHANGATPVLVEVTRGAMVESRHRGHATVVDSEGGVVMSWGEAEATIYPRSAIKPLQAIALVESGAADAYGLGDAEIALACASHGGETRHAQLVTAWLERVGLGPGDLACGAHWPLHKKSARVLAANGHRPTPAHNNCSGKHAAMLTTARHLGESVADYVAWEHPVQQRLLGLMEQLAGLDLGNAPRGIDGCGIPVYGVPLGNLALAFARFADPARLPPARAEAARRIQSAMIAEPYLVAGTGRFCTEVIEATQGDAIVKTGAEGVYCAALPRLGLGVAVKIEDGAARAAEIALAAILRKLGVLGEARAACLADRLRAPRRNWPGTHIGDVRPTAVLAEPPS